MRKHMIFFLVCAFGINSYGQKNVFSFFEFDIKDGMTKQFINGYAQDIEWHKEQGDEWSWMGWFVSKGPRTGRFIDATPDHTWEELGNWKINGEENGKMNDIHWAQYFENPESSWRIVLEDYSTYDSYWYGSPMLQVYTFELSPGEDENFKKFMMAFKKMNQQRKISNSLVWMQTVSGGSQHQYQLFITAEDMKDFETIAQLLNLNDYGENEKKAYRSSVKKLTTELWNLNTKLSLIHKN